MTIYVSINYVKFLVSLLSMFLHFTVLNSKFFFNLCVFFYLFVLCNVEFKA